MIFGQDYVKIIYIVHVLNNQDTLKASKHHYYLAPSLHASSILFTTLLLTSAKSPLVDQDKMTDVKNKVGLGFK